MIVNIVKYQRGDSMLNRKELKPTTKKIRKQKSSTQISSLPAAEEDIVTQSNQASQNLSSDQIIHLQRTIGNQAVQRLLAKQDTESEEKQSPSTEVKNSTESDIPTVTQRKSKTLLQRWDKIGGETYDGPFGRINKPVWVGTEDEWRNDVEKMDDGDYFKENLQGFLQLADDPGKVGQTSHPDGWKNYENTIERSLTENEIMDFMRGLFGNGKDADFTPNIVWGDGSHLRYMRHDMKKVINKYLPKLLKEVAANKGNTAGGDEVAGVDYGGVAEEVGPGIRKGMIESGVATAIDGLAMLVVASAKGEESEKHVAFNTIEQAGELLHQTLTVHDTAIKDAEAVNKLAIETILSVSQLDKVPGLETLAAKLPTIKSHLEGKAVDMAKGFGISDDIKEMVAAVAKEFRDAAEELAPGGQEVLDANTVRISINTFESKLSKRIGD